METREILNDLLSKYNRILFDHRTPIDQTTNEYHEMIGYDKALKNIARDLESIIKNIK